MLDNFNIQFESFETFRQFFDIEIILLFEKSTWTFIYRFINSVSFFYFDDKFDIQSESQYHFEFRNFQYSRCFNIEIIYFFRKCCQNIFVFFTNRLYFLIWTIISISISKIVRIFIDVWYCNYFFFRKFFDIFFIYLANQHLFSVSMLNSISNFRNFVSKIIISKTSKFF